MTYSATIRTNISTKTTVTGDIETGEAAINTSDALVYGDGAGAGQANLEWSDRRTLEASASESLDFSGSLAGLLGTKVFARIKYIRIIAAAGNTNNLVVTRPAASGVPFVDAEAKVCPDIRPGGKFEWGDPGAAGVVVTASTGDLLSIANGSSGTPVTYDIVVIGASA